jgi:hypothetical protein
MPRPLPGKLLFEEYGKGSQDLNYIAIYAVSVYHDNAPAEVKRVRISIKRDAYDNQSYAKAEVFSTALDSWQYLAHIHYANMITLTDCYVQRSGKLERHHTDVDILLNRAASILRGVPVSEVKP